MIHPDFKNLMSDLQEVVATPGTIKTANRMVACTPFEKRGVEKTTSNGFAVAKQQAALESLRVVFDSDNYSAGTVVYVHSQLSLQTLAKNVYTVEGKQFILVPESEIVLADTRKR